jgi:hypothetical protein
MAMAATAGAVAIAAMLAAMVTAGAVATGGAVAMATMVPTAGPVADPPWFLGNSRWPRRLTGWWSAGADYDWSPFPQEIG